MTLNVSSATFTRGLWRAYCSKELTPEISWKLFMDKDPCKNILIIYTLVWTWINDPNLKYFLKKTSSIWGPSNKIYTNYTFTSHHRSVSHLVKPKEAQVPDDRQSADPRPRGDLSCHLQTDLYYLQRVCEDHLGSSSLEEHIKNTNKANFRKRETLTLIAAN